MSYLNFSAGQTLRFVIHEPDKPQAYDNRLFSELVFNNVHSSPYCQQIGKFNPYLDFQFNIDSGYSTNCKAYLIDDTGTETVIALTNIYTASDGTQYYNGRLVIGTDIFNGKYQIRIDNYDSGGTTLQETWYSEPFEITDNYKDLIYVEWYKNNNDYGWNDGIYWNSIHAFIYLHAEMMQMIPEQSKTIYTNSDYEPIMLEGAPINRYTLKIDREPYYMLEKLNIAINHEYCSINDSHHNFYQTDQPINAQPLGRSLYYSGELTLTKL